MSAADWTRMQRRRAGTTYGPTVMNIRGVAPTNKDVVPPDHPQVPYGKALLIPAEGVGHAKTQRAASDWTNYVASGLSDYVLTSQGSGRVGETGDNNNYMTQKVNRICSCTAVITLPKRGNCVKCGGAAQRLTL